MLPLLLQKEGEAMAQDNKSTYTEARKKAIQKYFHESVEEFKVRFPKGQKAEIKAHADTMQESMNAFILRAIAETMQRDRKGGKAS